MAREHESSLVFKRGSQTTLSEIFRVLLRAERLKIRTCIPATVQSYNAALQRARVRVDILTKRYTDDGSTTDPALVIDVPVRHPRTSFGFLHLPIVKGDTGHIIVSDRSLDNWMRNGGEADDPKLLHTHSLIDGIFELGLHPNDKPISGVTANDAAVLEAVLIRLGLNATESAVLGNAFASLYNDLVTKFNAHTHVTTATIDGGPVGVIAPPVAQADPMVQGVHLSNKVKIE